MTLKPDKQKKPADAMLHRAQELNQQGFDWPQAVAKSFLEHRISEWPSKWGDDLEILIYGDFSPPNSDLHIPELRITVYLEKLQNTVIRSAMTVVKAKVTIDDKSIPAIIDAIKRINVFLGGWTLVQWGNGAIGWWSWITHGSIGGVGTKLDHEDLHIAINGIQQLPNQVRKKVDAAMYWVREPKNLLMNSYREDLLRVYASYWNAFECLVDAVNTIKPKTKLTKAEKQKQIDLFISERSGKLNPADIQKCYQEIVNPGFVGNASCALKICFGNEADYYINECFKLEDKENRLYNIRNAINHGEVDAEHPEELIRIQSRLLVLWMIVWRMFGLMIPFPAPVDPDSTQ